MTTAAENWTPTEGVEVLIEQLRRLAFAVEVLHVAVGELPTQMTPLGKRAADRVHHLSRIADEISSEGVDLADETMAKLTQYQACRRAAVRP